MCKQGCESGVMACVCVHGGGRRGPHIGTYLYEHRKLLVLSIGMCKCDNLYCGIHWNLNAEGQV